MARFYAAIWSLFTLRLTVEVKELYDNAYAVIDDLKKHNVMIRKANRLQERYITQLQNNQQGLAGAL